MALLVEADMRFDRRTRAVMSAGLLMCVAAQALAKDRVAYLDHPCDPYYVGLDFPKLTTPQWVGEQGVEAVVILSIDDMRDSQKYEDFLRPLLNRLKQIDGRAPLSVFTNSIDPHDRQVQRWIDEGLSIEVHTADHPCPLLQGGDFAKARSTYNRCVDNLVAIPRMRPVAFRMPCCDSQNTPSPRFWTEIFERSTEQGSYLEIDSSVFNVTTSADRSLPQEIVLTESGEERFPRYIPFPSFVNTIHDYPYPYLIGKHCWEFPCAVSERLGSAKHPTAQQSPDGYRLEATFGCDGDQTRCHANRVSSTWVDSQRPVGGFRGLRGKDLWQEGEIPGLRRSTTASQRPSIGRHDDSC